MAFLSTLYGVLSARMIYMPAASRLEREVEAQCLRDSLVTEGMVMLARKKSPTFIRDRLNAFLQPRARNYFNTFDGVADPGPAPAQRCPVVGRLSRGACSRSSRDEGAAPSVAGRPGIADDWLMTYADTITLLLVPVRGVAGTARREAA